MRVAGEHRRLRKEAFALVEILIALGIAAMAVAGICSLFPHVLKIAREGEEEARAARMAGNIMGILASSQKGKSLMMATGSSGDRLVLEEVSDDGAAPQVAYGPSCQPVRKLTPEEAASPIGDPDISDIAILRLGSNKSLPGLLVAEVDVLSPSSAPGNARTSRRFVRLLPVTPR
jgi:type II secretory pathway pseudopilin PulG